MARKKIEIVAEKKLHLLIVPTNDYACISNYRHVTILNQSHPLCRENEEYSLLNECCPCTLNILLINLALSNRGFLWA